jgi:hypothetical protein
MCGTGWGYGHPSSHGTTFSRNIKNASKRFPLSRNGKFGSPSSGRNVQQIVSKYPAVTAKELFSILSRGGIKIPSHKEGMSRVQFSDGTTIVLRMNTKSGSPAIDINPGSIGSKNLAVQKIHFESEIK